MIEIKVISDKKSFCALDVMFYFIFFPASLGKYKQRLVSVFSEVMYQVFIISKAVLQNN